MTDRPSFAQRFGIATTRPIETDFPASARNALMYLLQQLVEKNYVAGQDAGGWKSILVELSRIARVPFSVPEKRSNPDQCSAILGKMPWFAVFTFCERLYSSLLQEDSYYDGYNQEQVLRVSLEVVRKHYTDEINNLLSEENLGYRFVDGVFEKPGRLQTQRNLNKAMTVLGDNRLANARRHFNKAHKFFSNRERPDFENTVKEAVCALESATEALSGVKVSQDFAKEVSKLSGTQPGSIPPPIAQAMTKIYAYRGAGQGVAHGTNEGPTVTRLEAELVLSTVAAFITYLFDFYGEFEEDIPF